jgi:hypothetical protein
MAVDYRTEETVREAAATFRRTHGALDWSAKVDDLIKLKGYGQEVYRPRGGVAEWLKRQIKAVTKKVLALVSVKEQLILISDELPQPRVPFAKAHELGHAVLPWHNAIFWACDEHDLMPGTRDQLEFEANTFASEIIFPDALMQPFRTNYPVSLETVLLLKQTSGGSIEAAAYAYVRNHPEKVVLVVLDHVKDEEGNSAGLKIVRRTFSPPGVRSALSDIEKVQTFAPGHVFVELSRTRNTVHHCKCSMGEHRFDATVFNNSYKTFVLIHAAA